MELLLWSALALAALPAALILANLRALRPPRAATAPGPKTSILIPARNERANIAAAVRAALAATAADAEVLVLDDGSTDGTAEAARRAGDGDARLRVLAGRPVPSGAWGKPFACQQLAEAARGELLLFVDADVVLAPDAPARLAAELLAGHAAMSSGVPRQITETFSERLLVPLIHFILLGYLPIARMRRDRSPNLGAACGQLVLVRRGPYFAAGGHAAVLGRSHDGLALARRMRAAGFATDLTDATDLARCRMYSNWRAVLAGFAKNAHEGLGSRGGLVPWTALLLVGQTLPAALLPFTLGSGRRLAVAAAALLLGLGARILLARRFRQTLLGAVLHPFGVALLVAIQWYAVLRRAARRPVAWKGRTA